MRFTEASDHRVVSTSTAKTVAKVAGFVVEPAEQRVAALHLRKVDGDGDTLLWSALTAFGPDAVTVPGVEAITRADGRIAELGDKRHTMLGKRVLTEAGDLAGEVQDVEFDPATGRIVALVTGSPDSGTLDGARLLGVGPYAVVVRRG